MNNQTIKSALQTALENEIHPAQIRLWPDVQQRLATRKRSLFPHGDASMKTNLHHTPILRRVSLALLAIAIAFAILLATPQGRAWAQSILQFFTRATGDTLPAPTPQPLGWVDLTTPGAPAATITPLPSPTGPALSIDCGSLRAPKCSIEQIRGQVSFTIKELANIPEGLYFTGATGGPDGVYLSYDTVDHSGFINIKESPWTGSPEQKAWKIGASAVVETVDINGLPGEYVKGSFGMTDKDPTVVWDGNSGSQTLHWVNQGVFFEMESAGPAIPVDLDRFVSLAKSLTTAPVAKLATPAPTAETEKAWDPKDTYNLSLPQAEQQSGFKLILPSKLPDILSLIGATYESEGKIVTTFYLFDQKRWGPNTDGLSLRQQVAPNPKDCMLCGMLVGDGKLEQDDQLHMIVAPEAKVETVQIGTVSGKYVEGGWKGTDCCGWQWDPNPYFKTLRWWKNGMAFEITYMGMAIEKSDMLKIAESMK
jgi:hypothetical protein